MHIVLTLFTQLSLNQPSVLMGYMFVKDGTDAQWELQQIEYFQLPISLKLLTFKWKQLSNKIAPMEKWYFPLFDHRTAWRTQVCICSGRIRGIFCSWSWILEVHRLKFQRRFPWPMVPTHNVAREWNNYCMIKRFSITKQTLIHRTTFWALRLDDTSLDCYNNLINRTWISSRQLHVHLYVQSF